MVADCWRELGEKVILEVSFFSSCATSNLFISIMLFFCILLLHIFFASVFAIDGRRFANVFLVRRDRLSERYSQLLLFLLYNALSVSHYQLAEVVYLYHELLATVGVADEHPVVFELFELYAAVDVGAFQHRLFLALKWLVLNELESVRIVYQRVARDAGGLVVWF